MQPTTDHHPPLRHSYEHTYQIQGVSGFDACLLF